MLAYDTRIILAVGSKISCALFLLLCICFANALAQSENESDALAIVNGKCITRKEVDDSIRSQLYGLQQQIYLLRKTALENLITRALLEEEARKRGISIEELKKRMTAGKVEVPQSLVEKVYAENINAFGNTNPDEVKERVRLDLESQERMRSYKAQLAELRKNANIDVRLSEPLPAVVKVSDTGPSIGSKNAPVTIVEFSDFQCPFCKRSIATIKQILQTYGDRVRLVFKQMPLPIHPQAFAAAQASVCAAEQGKFWEYHDRLFSADDLSLANLHKMATELGLNAEKFNSCLASESSRAAVENDFQEGRKLGVNGTPTFFINGRAYSGAMELDEFKRRIENELKLQGKTGYMNYGRIKK